MIASICFGVFAVILAATAYSFYHHAGSRKGRLTRREKERRELLPVLRPYVKRRQRDAHGQALKRAAQMAFASKKISRRQLELFVGKGKAGK